MQHHFKSDTSITYLRFHYLLQEQLNMSSTHGLCLCVVCNAPAALRCSKCKNSFYCSNGCQKADWKLHKQYCSNINIKEKNEKIVQDENNIKLHKAIEANDISIVTGILNSYPLLINYLDDISREGNQNSIGNVTPLYMASKCGDINMVKLILDKGGNTNLVDNMGRTALMVSVVHEQYDIIELLLQYGADINLIGIDTKPALTYATSMGFTGIVELLLKQGAIVDAVDSSRRSALMEASSHGYINIVKLLVQYGADMNKRDRFGCTPLMSSCAFYHIDSAIFLISRGADVTILNNNCVAALNMIGTESESTSAPKVEIEKISADNEVRSESEVNIQVFKLKCEEALKKFNEMILNTDLKKEEYI